MFVEKNSMPTEQNSVRSSILFLSKALIAYPALQESLHDTRYCQGIVIESRLKWLNYNSFKVILASIKIKVNDYEWTTNSKFIRGHKKT